MNLDRNPGAGRGHTLLALSLVNAAYATLLIGLAVMPAVPNSAQQIPDDVAHAIAYGLQAVLLYALLDKGLATVPALALACFGAIGLGLFTEGLQLLQPSRASQAADVLANAIGVAAAAIVIMLVRGRKRTRGVVR